MFRDTVLLYFTFHSRNCLFYVSQAIIDSPYIAEAAVIGVPDKLKGSVPLGLCVPQHGKFTVTSEAMFTKVSKSGSGSGSNLELH